MSRVMVMIAAAALGFAATAVSPTRAEAGYRSCSGPYAGVSPYGFGRYGRYDYGYCNAYGYPPAHVPPAYHEQEPAYDGYGMQTRNLNLNFYYDYPSYRRIEYERPCCRPYR